MPIDIFLLSFIVIKQKKKILSGVIAQL